jgi:glycosyltransferase involved in cell wall biosynthesis
MSEHIYLAKHVINKVIPMNYANSIFGKLNTRRPKTSLTYSIWHLVLRDEPWIMETGSLIDFAWNPWQLRLLKSSFLKRLESQNCKFIITWYDILRYDLIKFFGSSKLTRKVLTVPRAVKPKPRTCEYKSDGQVRILFVGSGSQRGEFFLKGGPEVVSMFENLSHKFKNVELWIRSDMPSSYVERCTKNPGIKVIKEIIPREQLHSLYLNSHIFVQPSHLEEWGTILEAKSFGLPTVACDVYGQNELIEDGQDGLLVKDIPITYDNMRMRLSGRLDEFTYSSMKPCRKVVKVLTDYVSDLVQDSSLRRRLGEAAQRRTTSVNSINYQRELLKKIFDSAME